MKITNMKREIKFRAWEVNKGLGGRMTEPFTLIDIHNRKYVATGFADRIEFMQFTGLLDKNGKEIYEGDILRSLHYKLENQDPKYLYHKVIYDTNHAFFDAINVTNKDESLLTNGNCFLYVALKDNTIEVIGNIYENPDLL